MNYHQERLVEVTWHYIVSLIKENEFLSTNNFTLYICFSYILFGQIHFFPFVVTVAIHYICMNCFGFESRLLVFLVNYSQGPTETSFFLPLPQRDSPRRKLQQCPV